MRHVLCPDFSGGKFGVPVAVIFFIKFSDFVLFLGKCFDDAVSADILLHKGVEGRELLAYFLEAGTPVFGLAQRHEQREGQHHAHTERKLPTDCKDHDQREEKQKDIFIHLIDHKSDKVPYGIHIPRLAA